MPELAPVTYQLQVAFVRDIFELNVRMGDFVQEQGVASDVANRLAAENWLRHPREGRKFVDDPTQVTDLAHDARKLVAQDYRIPHRPTRNFRPHVQVAATDPDCLHFK